MEQMMTSPNVPSALYLYSLLSLVGLVGAVGDAAVNKWALTSSFWWWLVASFIWIVAATLFGLVLRWQSFTFGVAVVLALLVHSGFALFLDYQHFGGRLNRWSWAGIVCALAAIYLIEIGRHAYSPHQPGE